MDNLNAKVDVSHLSQIVDNFPHLPTREYVQRTISMVKQLTANATAHSALIGQASDMARAGVQRAEDIINSTPYHAVTIQMRSLHEASSILRALVILHQLNGCVDTAERQTGLIEALRVLDMTLLISGCPSMATQVQSLVAGIVPQIAQPPATLPMKDSIYDPAPPMTRILIHNEPPPTLQEFAKHIAVPEKATPILIRGAQDHWPAVSTRPWSNLTALRRRIGMRLVPIEIGKRYTDHGWGQKLMTFNEFIDRFLTEDGGADGGLKEVGYLAQHDLFRQIPELFADVGIPEYCYAAGMILDDIDDNDDGDDGGGGEVTPSVWFGPRGTVSPLHTDPRMNLFAQVGGRKYVRLYAPSQTAKVYPYGAEGSDEDGEKHMLGNTSRVDVEDPDLEAYPQFADAEYVECVVGPGDLLFIPSGWWHYVRSLSVSFSVSFWFG